MPAKKFVFEADSPVWVPRNELWERNFHLLEMLRAEMSKIRKEYKQDTVAGVDSWGGGKGLTKVGGSLDIDQLVGEVINRCKTSTKDTLSSHTVGATREIRASTKSGANWIRLGVVYPPEEAFPALGGTVVVARRGDGKEHILDAWGNWVARYVRRFVTDRDVASITTSEGIKATKSASKDTPLEHVAGKVPSQYISFTRSFAEGGIQNAHGETFGERWVKVDLGRVPKEHIYDLSTPEGEAKMLTGLNRDKLTDQHQQAVKDAKRTKEVLVQLGVPQEAITERHGF